jgi:competence protein ComEA
MVFLLNVSNAYSANQNGQKWDINKATVEQLVQVKGVGATKAKAILEFVKRNHVKSMDDLLKVKGVGKKVLENIKSKFEVRKE